MTLNHSGVMEIILHFHNFMNDSKCPVPKEQQPTNEFIELSKSRIFSWPKTKKSLILVLIKFWLGAFVLFLVVSSGSVYFKTSTLKYVLLSFFSSLSIPLLLSNILRARLDIGLVIGSSVPTISSLVSSCSSLNFA